MLKPYGACHFTPSLAPYFLRRPFATSRSFRRPSFPFDTKVRCRGILSLARTPFRVGLIRLCNVSKSHTVLDIINARIPGCLLYLLCFLVLVRRSGRHRNMQSYPSMTLTSDKIKTRTYGIVRCRRYTHRYTRSHMGTPTVTAASVRTEVGSLLFGRHEGCTYVYVALSPRRMRKRTLCWYTLGTITKCRAYQ